jgi:photosystem II stability/assembly factor-like uncharacterized protein
MICIGKEPGAAIALVSHDGGQSFSRSSVPPSLMTVPRAITLAAPESVFIGGYALGSGQPFDMRVSKLLRSPDGGGQWAEVAMQPEVASLGDIAFVSERRGFVAASVGSRLNEPFVAAANGVFRTEDGGDSWAFEQAGSTFSRIFASADGAVYGLTPESLNEWAP